ncbi:retrotransposon protein, putative, ty1-copia subclass [Tanacetum coccineum]|uniref:Retrotransposon protein, putative, ty1-copia subclass n=1 Tax=Tanacetum coccineum TaxID=301880 RepID=A0ABQ4WQ65_9ASTR
MVPFNELIYVNNPNARRKALDDDDGDMLMFISSLDSRFFQEVYGNASNEVFGKPREVLGVVVQYGVSMSAVSSQSCFSRKNQTLNAINVEMQSIKDNEVWELVDLPSDGKTVGHKWLFKMKTDMDGAVHTYKAHIRAIRIVIAIAAFYDYEIWQMDVKNAFLNGYLNEEVYMEQPKDFVNQKFPNRLCKLKRSIYGLKQASRQWNKRFDDEIKKFGFSQNRDEPSVYVKASGSYVTFLILYVDDILIMGNNILMLQDVKSYLGRCFAMKDLGEAANILGIKIYRDRSKRLIGLCQSAYIDKILK